MMSITKDMGLLVLAHLFPPVCLACQRVEGVSSLTLGLCSNCHRQLDLLRDATCPPLPSGHTALDGLLSRWAYAPPFDSVIQALKFGRLEFLGRDLADSLHCLLTEQKELDIDVVIPIPLHWHRRLARGYNQAEAIASPLAKRLRRPMVHALRRNRSTRPQALLGRRQRQINLRRAFAIRRVGGRRILNRRVLLVDDVVTTGATLVTAADCLRTAGAQSVLAVTAGRTPTTGGFPSNTT